MNDPRLSATVFIGTRAVHQPVGSPGAPANVAVRDAAAAWTSFITVSQDVRNSTAGPLAQGQAIARAASPAAGVTQKAAAAIIAAHASVKARADVPAIKPWTDTSTHYASVATGLELAKHFRSLSPGERASTLAEIRNDPQANRAWLEALVGAPTPLSGISREEHAGLQVTAKRAADPEAFEALAVEMAQVNGARKAVERMVSIAAEHGAPRGDLQALPEVAALLALPALAFAPEDPPAPRHAAAMAGAIE